MQHLPTQRASSVNERRMSEHNKMIKLIHQKKGNAIFIHRGSIVESEPTELSTRESYSKEKKRRITKSHSQKAKLRVQSVLNFDEIARQKQNEIEKKWKEAERMKIKKLEKIKMQLDKDNAKREHKLNNFLHIEEEKEMKRK